METVTVSRHLDAPPEEVRALVADAEPFIAAGGFDEVTADGDRIELTNRLGLATVELVVERRDDDAALSFEQREGIFSEMTTTYEVQPADGGSRVVATTEFELGKAVVGDFLDGTIIRRQRLREIEAQFDYLAEQVGN